MGAYLRPLVSRRLNTTIIGQKKKDFGKIENIEKIVKRMFTLELLIRLCACMYVCMCVWIIFACCCVWAYMCMCAYDDTSALWQI